MEKVTESIINVGVNDKEITLFEGQYKIRNGMAYNSYLILDEKTAVMDTGKIYSSSIHPEAMPQSPSPTSPPFQILM